MPVSLLLALALASSPLQASPHGGDPLHASPLQRIDLLSEDPGTWLNDELPSVLAGPARPGLRLLEQVKFVWRTPVPRLTIGTSLTSQSVAYDRPLFGLENLTVGLCLYTRLLLPRGVYADLAWHRGPLRLAVGLSALSNASWARPQWDWWRFLPTVGIGVEFGQ